MTVRIEKPAINVREELADLRKPSGVAGEAMLRAETPQEQFNLIGAGRRNLIINGGFDVWQRGTSFALGNQGYTADRWYSYQGVTFSQSLTKSSLTELGYSADILSNSSNGYAMIAQVVENTSQLKGAYTLSFNIKSTDTGSIRIEFRRNTDGVTIWQDIDYATASSDWQKVTKTITLDETDDLRILIGVNSGTGGATVSIAQVQLEVGKVATPFEHRSYGEELALCQRYYQVLIDNANGQRPVVAGRANSGTTVEFQLPLTVGMRDITSLPQSNLGTIYLYSGGARVNTTSGTVSLNDDYSPGSSYAYLRTTGASVSDDRAYTIGGFLADAHLAVDGEL